MSITDRLCPSHWPEAASISHFCDESFVCNLIIRPGGLWPKGRTVKFTFVARAHQLEVSLLAKATIDQSGRWPASFVALSPRVLRHQTDAEVGPDIGVALALAASEDVQSDSSNLLRPCEAERPQRGVLSQKTVSTSREQEWIQITGPYGNTCYFIATSDLRINFMVWAADTKVGKPEKTLGRRHELNGAIPFQACFSSRRRCCRNWGPGHRGTPHQNVHSGSMGPTFERRGGIKRQPCAGTCFQKLREDTIRGRDVLRR